MLVLSAAIVCTAVPQLKSHDPPKVLELSPANRARDVDPKAVTQLKVIFDRAMNTNGWSLCGGGPNYPKLKGRPAWKDAKTLVCDVELEPNHRYELLLNCPAAQNFKSAAGVALPSTPWSFKTGSGAPPAPLTERQKARNKAALDKLTKTLAEHYSYYDLRVKDWAKLVKEHTPELLNANSDLDWANAAAAMLTATEDIHMHLECQGEQFSTGSRAVDSLYRHDLLQKYLTLETDRDQLVSGVTRDHIGYLMIGSWTKDVDLDAAEHALAELLHTKAMIVDARPNCGGGEDLALRVAAWFVEGTRTYAKDRFRLRAGKDGFGQVLDRTITGNADASRRYTAPIAVLTSKYVMSSNESFVMMLRQAKDCTVVGQATYGSSGNPRPYDLDNGVKIIIPSWQDLRLDGTCLEGEGLAPDVEVKFDVAELERRDPILERALEVLRGKRLQ
ncbi:MAG: S41 family peptidase [Planctomycetota bacterium]